MVEATFLFRRESSHETTADRDGGHSTQPCYLIARYLVGDAPYFLSHATAMERRRMVTLIHLHHQKDPQANAPRDPVSLRPDKAQGFLTFGAPIPVELDLRRLWSA